MTEQQIAEIMRLHDACGCSHCQPVSLQPRARLERVSMTWLSRRDALEAALRAVGAPSAKPLAWIPEWAHADLLRGHIYRGRPVEMWGDPYDKTGLVPVYAAAAMAHTGEAT